MPTRKNLPLEEKLKIPIWELPFSKEVKNEFKKKGVHKLEKLYNKFLGLRAYDGSVLHIRPYLPGFTKEAYKESKHLLSVLNLLPEDQRLAEEYTWSYMRNYANKEV